MKKTPRIALGVLIGWTVGIVVLVITGALVAPAANSTEPSTWTEQDYRSWPPFSAGF